MQVLIKLMPAERLPSDTPDVLAKRVFERVNDEYNESAADKEAYIHEPDGQAGLAEELELVDGMADPEAIVGLAESWNKELAADFQTALSDAMAGMAPDGPPEKWLDVPSAKIYELKKAAASLNGSFHDFAEKVLYLDHGSAWYFTTRLEDQELADIMANPKDYAAITVYPK